MSLQELLENVQAIGSKIIEWNTTIQIGYTEDADALIASALFGRVLHDLQKPFVIFKIQDDYEKKFENKKDYNCILIGIEPSKVKQIQLINEYIILAKPQKNNVNNPNIINSGQYGYLSPEAPLTAIAYLVCDPIADKISRIIYLPLIAYHSHHLMSEYIGLTDIIAQHAISEGLINTRKGFAFLGTELFTIAQAILYSQDPYLPGLSGNENSVIKLLSKAGITVETSVKERKISDLDEEEIKDLNSNLVVFLAEYKGHQEDKLTFVKTKTFIKLEQKNSILSNTWDYSVAINDAIKRNKEALALIVLLGNRSNELLNLTKLFREERKALVTSFELLADRKGEVIELKNLRYLKVNKKISWYNTSVAAAMGLSNGLVSIDLPFVVIAPGPYDLQTIGFRASKQHRISRNLTQIIKEIVKSRQILSKIEGSSLSFQIAVPSQEVDNVLLDLNGKLGEYKK